jgi:hypothetical protein
MWSQYLRTQEGIAIRSYYKRLGESFARYQDFEIYMGMVKYIDYESDTIPWGNMLAPTMYKRKSFEHERELRAVIWTLEHGKIRGRTTNLRMSQAYTLQLTSLFSLSGSSWLLPRQAGFGH